MVNYNNIDYFNFDLNYVFINYNYYKVNYFFEIYNLVSVDLINDFFNFDGSVIIPYLDTLINFIFLRVCHDCFNDFEND